MSSAMRFLFMRNHQGQLWRTLLLACLFNPCNTWGAEISFHLSDRAHGHPRKPHHQLPGDRDLSETPPKRYVLADLWRAGNPDQIAPWAQRTVNPQHYSAWYVGGGTPWLFALPTRQSARNHQGTWGLDYHGLFRPHRVWLRFGSDRAQGGTGQYETDFQPAWLPRRLPTAE